MSSLPRILLIFCGGTISMHKNEDTGALDVANDAEQFFQLEPRIKNIADISVHHLTNVDSTNMEPTDWEQMVEVISQYYEKYDGFVITMGTNTMAWASSALSFALQNLGKPVVFTGAQIPAESINTDARNNLVNALRAATMDIAGVFVVFGSKLMKGCRAKKVSESDLDAFSSFNTGDFGEISLGIAIKGTNEGRHSNPPSIRNGFEPNIICITYLPGLNADFFESLMKSGIKGIVLRSYGTGDIPYTHLPALEQARSLEIPIVATTQCRGSTIMGLNDPGLKAIQAGVIQAFDMSMEAMSTKMMWLLKQRTPYKEFKKAFHQNMVGEIDIKRTKFFVNKELEQLVDYRNIS